LLELNFSRVFWPVRKRVANEDINLFLGVDHYTHVATLFLLYFGYIALILSAGFHVYQGTAMQFLRVLLKWHLALLWSGQVLSAMGDYFYQIAVVWIAIQIARGAGGIVLAAQAGAALACGLLGGIYADRWNRRVIMIGVDVIRALVVGSLPVMSYLGLLHLWYLVLVGIVVGGLGSLFNPALQASLPSLAGDVPTLQAANGLMDITSRLARALAPALAGVLVTFLPLTHFFTLDAISFGISALSVLLLGRRFAWQPQRIERAAKGVRGIVDDLSEAVRLVQGQQVILWTMISYGVVNMAWSAAFVVGVPLLAKEVLKSGVGVYGLIVGAYGAGNVMSNLVIGSLVIRRRVLVMLLAQLIVGTGFLVMVSVPLLPVVLLGAALASLGGPMGDIIYTTLIQMTFPAHHLGKVYSLDMTISNVGGMVGLALAGVLFLWSGVVPGIICCALLIVCTSLVRLFRFRTMLTETQEVSHGCDNVVVDERYETL
jgi:DHA3 family macrolide efflux protein-like MFS transporter